MSEENHLTLEQTVVDNLVNSAMTTSSGTEEIQQASITNSSSLAASRMPDENRSTLEQTVVDNPVDSALTTSSVPEEIQQASITNSLSVEALSTPEDPTLEPTVVNNPVNSALTTSSGPEEIQQASITNSLSLGPSSKPEDPMLERTAVSHPANSALTTSSVSAEIQQALIANSSSLAASSMPEKNGLSQEQTAVDTPVDSALTTSDVSEENNVPEQTSSTDSTRPSWTIPNMYEDIYPVIMKTLTAEEVYPLLEQSSHPTSKRATTPKSEKMVPLEMAGNIPLFPFPFQLPTKKKVLTFAEKKKLISDFKTSGSTQSAFAKKHGLARTTLHSILAGERIMEHCNNDNRKRWRYSNFASVEQALLVWMRHARSLDIHLTSNILKQKALEIAAELNVQDFMASNGWVERFKARNGVCFKKMYQKKGAEDQESSVGAKDVALAALSRIKLSAVSKTEPSSTITSSDASLPPNLTLEPNIIIKEEPIDIEEGVGDSSPTPRNELIVPDASAWSSAPSIPTGDGSSSGSSRKRPRLDPASLESVAQRLMKSSSTPDASSVKNGDLNKDVPDRPRDQIDSFTEYVGAKLRQLDHKSCAYVQKAISDLLFDAEMGKYK